MLCGAFLIALVVGVIALILSNLRHHAIEQSKQQLLATATVLARQAARDFQSIDLIEANLIEYMETLAIVSDELYARAMVGRGIHLMLKDKISGFPHIGAVMLIGADGRLINSSQAWPTPPLNFAGQDYFEALKTSPRLSSMLGEPTRDPQTGVWTIYFARKFRGSNGEFLGLVVGTVASQYFEESYGTLARGTDELIALFRDDGVMLARYPHIDSFIGKSFVRNVPDGMTQRSGSGVAGQRDVVDDSERLIAEARLPNVPINLTASTTVAAALADWRTEAGYLIGLTIVLVVAIGGTGAVVVQFFRRQSIQLDSTLNNLSQGVCMYDEHQRLILCNDRYAEMFHLPHELTTPGTTLRQIFDHQVAHGLHPGSGPDEYIRGMMAIITACEPASIVTEFSDGRAMVTVFRPAPGGGFVTTVEDITEQKRAEKRIAHIAHHDPLTGPAQSRGVFRLSGDDHRRDAARGRDVRDPVPRPRPLQGGQRPLRPSGRRRAAARGGAASASRCGRCLPGARRRRRVHRDHRRRSAGRGRGSAGSATQNRAERRHRDSPDDSCASD